MCRDGTEGSASMESKLAVGGQQKVLDAIVKVGKEGILGRNRVKRDFGQAPVVLPQVPSIIQLSWCPRRAPQ